MKQYGPGQLKFLVVKKELNRTVETLYKSRKHLRLDKDLIDKMTFLTTRLRYGKTALPKFYTKLWAISFKKECKEIPKTSINR